MSEDRQTQVNRVELRPLVAKDFESSEEFVAKFGRWVTAKGMFLPLGVTNFRVGQELELRLTLAGRREILAGTARVVFVRDGANGEVPGCGVTFVELSKRSQKNLEMIVRWRAAAEQL